MLGGLTPEEWAMRHERIKDGLPVVDATELRHAIREAMSAFCDRHPDHYELYIEEWRLMCLLGHYMNGSFSGPEWNGSMTGVKLYGMRTIPCEAADPLYSDPSFVIKFIRDGSTVFPAPAKL